MSPLLKLEVGSAPPKPQGLKVWEVVSKTERCTEWPFEPELWGLQSFLWELSPLFVMLVRSLGIQSGWSRRPGVQQGDRMF